MSVPDLWNILPIVSLAELSGDALSLFRTQVGVILDVMSFLFTEALEYFHGLGNSLHDNIISHRGFG